MKYFYSGAAIALSIFGFSSACAAGQINIGATGGTLGFGPQIGVVIVPNKFDARMNVGIFNYNHNTTSGGISYDGKLKLENVVFLADYHPFDGSFRFTGGLFYNKNRFDLSGQMTGGSFAFNGRTYSAAQVGTVSANVTFRKIAPYFGVGWGDNSNSAGLHFTSDLGFMYQGSPNATITATGAASNQRLASDITMAKYRLQSDLNNYKWYPVLQAGFAYRF